LSKKLFGINIPSELSKSNYYALFISTGLIMMAYMIPTIILPRFLKETIGISDADFGEINSTIQNIGTITSILFLAFVGSLSDKHGRKILLLSGLLGTTVAFVLYSYSPKIGTLLGLSPLWFIFLFQFLLSFSMVFAFPQLVTLAADYTESRSRGKLMAISATMMGLGITISFLFLSQLQKTIGVSNLLLVGAFLTFLTFLIVKFFIVDHMPHRSKEIPAKRNSTIKNWKEVSAVVEKIPGLKVCFFSSFAASADRIILGAFLTIWAVRVAKDFHITPARATALGGIIIGLSSLVALISTPFWGMLVDRFGRMQIITSGLFLKGLGFFLIGMTSNPFSTEVKLYGVLTGLGVAGAAVGTSSLAADLAPKRILGSIFSISSAIGSIGTLFFFQFGGFLFDYVGFSRPFSLVGIADFIVLAFAISKWKQVPKITKHIQFQQEHSRSEKPAPSAPPLSREAEKE